MSESTLYKEGGAITTSNVNKRNAELAGEYKNKMANEEKESLYGQAREEGIREGSNNAYMDVMQRLESSGQYQPIAGGSPEDIQMQSDIDRGLNYVTPEEPGLLDAVSNRLGSMSNGLSDWFTKGAEPDLPQEKSQLQKDQEFEQMQYDSEQAGLAELKQILNKQQ